jgi:fructoselysine 6-kinase
VRVTAVGDCGIDRYLNLGRDRPGGITLNFAANARRLFPACVTELEGTTSLQIIDREVSGEKIFVRYGPGVLADYRLGAREREVIARSDVLMAVVYSQIESFFDAVMDSPSPGLRAVDFGDLSGVTGGVEIVERYHERFHLGFFGLGAGDGALIDELECLARRHGRLFVVTLGPQGSLALGGERRIACPAVEVAQVVDTTGAGDTFAAGYLREYCVSFDVARSLACGAQEAAVAVQRVGAFPWDD